MGEYNSEQTNNGRIAMLLEQIRSPFGSGVARILEQVGSPFTPQMAKILEQARSPLTPQMTKVLEQARYPLPPHIAEILEQVGTPFTPHMAKILEQARSPLTPQMAKVLEQTPLTPQIAKILEQAGTPFTSQMAKILEQFRSPIMDVQFAKVIEQYRTPLEHSHFGKLFQNSFSKTGSPFSNLSIDALLNELERRRTVAEEEPDSDQKRPLKHVKAEGHATISVISTGEARVVQSDAVATDDVSRLPTWLINLLVIIFFSSIQATAQWESIRASVVDLNARLPQTESLAKIRNFIRKELAGKPGDIRLVTGSDVNFRSKPSTKSEIILKLPKNAIVVVLGKEDRTWLFVTYEIDGYWIDGYISTKYLRKVRED
ncbi:SH3 domain-containing protein [Pseudomonas sp. HTZ2]|uniref:SH3 domain-containing protein n=1 Tax=Pseudomonas sp. HTZ2 TaxID=3075220 RepID=UPI00295840CA|nr:SH3 domain-containing protein [Pseudomonas sp. HTZ2]